MASNETSRIYRAEQQVREIIIYKVNSGAYDEAIMFTELAKSISELQVGGGSLAAAAATKKGKGSTAAKALKPREKTRDSGTKAKRGRPPKKKAQAPVNAYPRFERDGTDLIRVSWHGTRKSEYRDRAPKEVLDKLVNKILKAYAKNQPLYATDRLFDIKDKTGKVIPKTKIYVCMSWLKKEGLIKSEGFGPNTKYIIPDSANMKAAIKERMKALPEKGTS